jgi:regulatory protein
MPLITDIKIQVKNTEKVSLFVDGKYSFSLTISQLAEHKILKTNQEISAKQVAEFKKLSNLTNLYIRMVGLVYSRPRSEFEIRTKLKLKKLSPEEVEELVSKLKLKGYLDDQYFAKWWVEGRKSSRPISKLKLKSELAQKGINSNLVNQFLEEGFSKEDELSSLKKLIAKKESKYPDQQKLIAHLASKGFSYPLIKECLKGDSDRDF